MSISSGITTGLLGYSLKKDLWGDSLFYRETETFNYEIYSVNLSSFSPSYLQNSIFNEFKNKYSGDITVKLFNEDGEYFFPNDSVRSSKYNVQVEIHKPSSNVSSQIELSSAYYTGVDYNFYNSYASVLEDFKESFNFSENEQGVQSFSHEVSFGLITGGKQLATTIVSGLFSADKDTTFGIAAMVSGVTVADSNNYQNYYTETYDTLRNSFSFSKKRDILPLNTSTFVYDLNHSINLSEDGAFNISEKCNLKGKNSFSQAQQGVETLLASSYGRCNLFFNTYKNLAGDIAITNNLNSFPIKTNKTYNRQSIEASYEINFTNNPILASDGSKTEENISTQVDEEGIVNISHDFKYTYPKRNSSASVINLISSSFTSSPTTINNYYTSSNFYLSKWPIKQIKYDMTWPSRKVQGSSSFKYSNHPKNFVVLGSITFNSLEYKVSDTKPVDIATEYKTINRPSNTSILNYAYQTEKGQIGVDISAGLGRNPNEFIYGFRNNISEPLRQLYKYGINVFINQFNGIIPIAFTYFLSDVKYSINSDGLLNLNLIFNYTLKKYIM